MSAFVVPLAHINAIVTFANRNLTRESPPRGAPKYTEPEELGQFLLNANVASVNYRYSLEDPTPEFRWNPNGNIPVSPLSFIKLLQCLDYQSCERDDWEGSLPQRTIERMQSAALRLMPGYDTLPWAFNEGDGEKPMRVLLSSLARSSRS